MMLSRALARSVRLPAQLPTRLPALSRPAIAASSTPGVLAPAALVWMRGMAANRSSRTQNQQSASNANATESSAPKPDLRKLPDLTQGIPSTLEFETSGATNKKALEAVEEETTEPQAGGSGRGRGELPASAYISSTEKRRNKFANYMYASALGLGVLGLAYLGREWDEEEEKAYPDIPNGWSLGLWWNRTTTRFGSVTNYYSDPVFDKLLPDPNPMFERPYTLCISLEDMLIHSEWTREHGWRVAKRPGVDYFLRYLSIYYELVLFTSVPYFAGEQLVKKLDPYHIITWPLFREATKYKDGEIVKDLSYLNRDLSKVIIIDTKAEHVREQPENAILLSKWTGDPKDSELVSLIPFLEYIHAMNYKDVREVLKSFKGKHIPTEFARREAIARAEFQKQFEKEKRNQKGGVAAIGGLFGLNPNKMNMMVTEGEISPAEAYAQGKMLQDIQRERGQRQYELLEKQIRENGEAWIKAEQEELEKAQAEAMSSMKSSFTSWFLPSKPEEKPSEPKK